MYYTIYQVINLINNKIYIGKHQTDNLDDDYMGSGRLLTRAQQKYGIENFKKEILFVFESEEEMNQKEKEIVNEEFLARSDVYNLCPGGRGGFGYINSKVWSPNRRLEHNISICPFKHWTSEEKSLYRLKRAVTIKNKIGNGQLKYYKNIGTTGQLHTEETKKKISIANKGKGTKEKNSQFGTIWITNGCNAKKIKKDEIIPDGYRKGRKLDQ